MYCLHQSTIFESIRREGFDRLTLQHYDVLSFRKATLQLGLTSILFSATTFTTILCVLVKTTTARVYFANAHTCTSHRWSLFRELPFSNMQPKLLVYFSFTTRYKSSLPHQVAKYLLPGLHTFLRHFPH